MSKVNNWMHFSPWAQGYIVDEKNWPGDANGVCQDRSGVLKFFTSDESNGVLKPTYLDRVHPEIDFVKGYWHRDPGSFPEFRERDVDPQKWTVMHGMVGYVITSRNAIVMRREAFPKTSVGLVIGYHLLIKEFSSSAADYVLNLENWPEKATGVCQDPDGELKFFSGLVEPKFGHNHWNRIPRSRIASTAYKDFNKNMTGDASKAMVWKHDLFVNLVEGIVTPVKNLISTKRHEPVISELLEEKEDMTANKSGLINFSVGAISFLSCEDNWPEGMVGVCQDSDGWLKFYKEDNSLEFKAYVNVGVWTEKTGNKNDLGLINKFKGERVPNPTLANVLKIRVFGNYGVEHFSDEAAAWLRVEKNWPKDMVGVCQNSSGGLKFYEKGWSAEFKGQQGWMRSGEVTCRDYINMYKFRGTVVHNAELAHVYKRNVVTESHTYKNHTPLPNMKWKGDPSPLYGFTTEAAEFLAVENNWPENTTGACQDRDGTVKFYISKDSARQSNTTSVWIRPEKSYKGVVHRKVFLDAVNRDNKDAHVRRSELFAQKADTYPLEYFSPWARNRLKKEENWPDGAVMAYQDNTGHISFNINKGVATTGVNYWHGNGCSVGKIDPPPREDSNKDWKKACVEKDELFNTNFKGFMTETVETGCSGVVEDLGEGVVKQQLPTLNTGGAWYPVYEYGTDEDGDGFSLTSSGLRRRGVLPKVLFGMAMRSHEYRYVAVDKIKMTNMYNASVEMGWCLVNGQKYVWRGD